MVLLAEVENVVNVVNSLKLCACLSFKQGRPLIMHPDSDGPKKPGDGIANANHE